MKIFIDYSGSTGNNSTYWQTVLSIIEANPVAQFYFWDSAYIKTSFADAIARASKKTGNGGTYPSCFLSELKSADQIIIITDGDISNSEVSNCHNYFSKNHIKLDKVEVYFIKTGGNINLSVAAPFIKSTEFTIYKDGELLNQGSTKNDVDLQKYYNDPALFKSEFDGLYTAIVAKNMGIANNELRDEVLKLGNNLKKCLSEGQNQNMNAESLELFRSYAKSADNKDALKFMKEFMQTVLMDDIREIDSMIQTLTNVLSNTSYNFDIMDIGRIRRAAVVDKVNMEDVPAEVAYTGDFECPVLMDTNCPSLLFKADEPLLSNLDQTTIETLINNPLHLLNNNQLVNNLKTRFDHVFGYNSAKILFEKTSMKINGQNIIKSPASRADVFGMLVMNSDDKQIKKLNRHTLAKLFFGTKLVGVPELWLYVVYKIATKIEYINSNAEFMDAFKNLVISELKTNTTYMTLTGLPIFPMVKMPIDISVWYCLNSEYLNSQTAVANRMRALGPIIQHLIDINDMFGYYLDTDHINKRTKYYNIINRLMYDEKNKNTIKCTLKDKIKTMWQNHMIVDDRIIFLDGKSTKIYLDDYEGLTAVELYNLTKLIDISKKSSEIFVPYNFTTELPAAEINYDYNPDISVHKQHIPICKLTMRPYSYDLQNKLHWIDSYKVRFGNADRFLSCCKYYVMAIEYLGRYPTKSEYIQFMYDKQCNRENPITTLPEFVNMFVNDKILAFAEATDNFTLDSSEVVKRFKHHNNKERRIIVDKSKTN